jgi:hypothetical protein
MYWAHDWAMLAVGIALVPWRRSKDKGQYALISMAMGPLEASSVCLLARLKKFSDGDVCVFRPPLNIAWSIA